MFKGDAFNTLFAPDTYRTLIDSDIVALSAADVLKLYAKASETEDVSAKAFAKDVANVSDIVALSETDLLKPRNKVSETEDVSATVFAKEDATASDIE